VLRVYVWKVIWIYLSSFWHSYLFQLIQLHIVVVLLRPRDLTRGTAKGLLGAVAWVADIYKAHTEVPTKSPELSRNYTTITQRHPFSFQNGPIRLRNSAKVPLLFWSEPIMSEESNDIETFPETKHGLDSHFFLWLRRDRTYVRSMSPSNPICSLFQLTSISSVNPQDEEDDKETVETSGLVSPTTKTHSRDVA